MGPASRGVAGAGTSRGRLSLNTLVSTSMVGMDINSYYTILIDLAWILPMIVLVLGVVYILIKPEEKKQ